MLDVCVLGTIGDEDEDDDDDDFSTARPPFAFPARTKSSGLIFIEALSHKSFPISP